MEKDRYVSFNGIESDANAKRVIELLRRHIDTPEVNNPFWDRFRDKLDGIYSGTGDGRRLDELFLIHSYTNNIRDVFEERGDAAALLMLQQVEEESC